MDANYYRGKVDFVIITIRVDEFEAVLERLPEYKNVEGRRMYAVGTVETTKGDFFTVAVTRCREQGQEESAIIARDVFDDLAPQCLLLVGIAGGVPAREFTLGDVIISNKITGFTVMAANFQKTFEFSVSGGSIDHKFGKKVAHLSAWKNELGDWGAVENISRSLPEVRFELNKFTGDKAWKEKLQESLHYHFGPNSTTRQRKVFSGNIGSSGILMKDPKLLKQWLKMARDIMAVEMELSGAYLASQRMEIPCPILSIRGISDIVGYKRSDDWTGFACQSAASFTFAFLKIRPIEPIAHP